MGGCIGSEGAKVTGGVVTGGGQVRVVDEEGQEIGQLWGEGGADRKTPVEIRVTDDLNTRVAAVRSSRSEEISGEMLMSASDEERDLVIERFLWERSLVLEEEARRSCSCSRTESSFFMMKSLSESRASNADWKRDNLRSVLARSSRSSC